jgi:lipoate-protein ligase A
LVKSYWRFLFTPEKDAFFNMATDEVLTYLCQKENRIPTLRLYTWSPPAVSLGYFQKVNSAIDIDKCKKFGIDVVRRPTGGRAVLHQDELTYSICASIENFPELGSSVSQTYQQISLAFLQVLKILGIKGEWVKKVSQQKKEKISEPCFVSSSRYEINIDNKKLIGSAQRRFGKVFLQHGSIPLKRNKISLAYFLPQKGEGVDRMEKSLTRHSTSIQELLNQEIEIHNIIGAVKLGFKKYFKIELVEQNLTDKELDRIGKLIQEKYCIQPV